MQLRQGSETAQEPVRFGRRGRPAAGARWRVAGRRRWRVAAAAVAGLAALLVASGCLPSAPAAPIDFPDPDVVYANGVYHAFATQGNKVNVQHMTSRDLVSWTPVKEALKSVPSWAVTGDTWAPEILRRGSQYVLYYTVHHATLKVQCVSAATAPTAAGPFTDDSSAPLVCQSKVGGSIDPSPYVAPDGQAYLFWKSTNARGISTIFGQRLASEGRALTGPRAELLVPTADWEQPQVEGPSMVRGPRGYYLFYSAGVFNTPGYAIGYAICTTPLQGCRKVTTVHPWVATNAFAAGPGGQSFFRDAHGALRMAYHAWKPGKVGYLPAGDPERRRSLWIGHLSFDSAGAPVLTA